VIGGEGEGEKEEEGNDGNRGSEEAGMVTGDASAEEREGGDAGGQATQLEGEKTQVGDGLREGLGEVGLDQGKRGKSCAARSRKVTESAFDHETEVLVYSPCKMWRVSEPFVHV